MEAAEAICRDDAIPSWDALEVLILLVDKSLVMVEEAEGASRFRLLESVREYAREKLAQSGDEALARRWHSDFYLLLAEKAEVELRGPEQALWLRRLETEHDNLRAALEWSRTADESGATGLRFVEALWNFWWIRGYLSEGRSWCAAVLTSPGAGGPTQHRAGVLNGAGILAW